MCSNNTKKYTREEVKQQMLDYIENKYDMEFEVKDVAYKSWAHDWEKMRAYSKGENPDDTFDVYRFTEDNGEVYFVDFYIRHEMQKAYTTYVEDFADKYFSEYKCRVVLTGSNAINDDVPNDATFDEYKKFADDNICVDIRLFIPEESENEVDASAKALIQELKDNIGEGMIHIFGFTEENYENDVKSKSDPKEYDTSYCSFEIEEDWID